MKHSISLTGTPEPRPKRFERNGGTDLTLTFGAEVVQANRFSRIIMALFGKIGMSMSRKALAKDLSEISAKAESL